MRQETLLHDLNRLAPFVLWDECREMSFECRAEHVASLDVSLQPMICAVYGCQPLLVHQLPEAG